MKIGLIPMLNEFNTGNLPTLIAPLQITLSLLYIMYGNLYLLTFSIRDDTTNLIFQLILLSEDGQTQSF